jgi:hypothetical protein
MDKLANGDATVVERSPATGLEMTLDAHASASGWTLERIRYAPAKTKGDHSLTISIRPGATPEAPSAFEVVAGKKTKLAAGAVTTTANSNGWKQSWTFVQPADASKQPVEAAVTEVH